MAADGFAIATVGVVTAAPGITCAAAEVCAGRSVVVDTDTVLAPAGPFVSPRRVIWSWSPASMNALENRPQLVTSPAGRTHEPTSTLRVTSRTVALCQPSMPVFGGSVTVSWLPASADRPPETLKVTT